MMRVKSGEEMSKGSSLTPLPIDFLYVRKTRSTMLIAKELAGKYKDIVFIAGFQTSGIGRQGRKWASPLGGLWFSFLFKPQISAVSAPLLGLAMAVSVVEALKVLGLNALVKWPNDVVVDGRKICGILVDAKARRNGLAYVVVGVGVNVNFPLGRLPEDLRSTAITTLELLGRELDLVELLDRILERFRLHVAVIERGEEGIILERVEKLLYGKGEKFMAVSERGNVKGILKGLGHGGSLIIEADKGVREVDIASIKKLIKL